MRQLLPSPGPPLTSYPSKTPQVDREFRDLSKAGPAPSNSPPVPPNPLRCLHTTALHCARGGATRYQDGPCGGDARTSHVPPRRARPGAPAGSGRQGSLSVSTRVARGFEMHAWQPEDIRGRSRSRYVYAYARARARIKSEKAPRAARARAAHADGRRGCAGRIRVCSRPPPPGPPPPGRMQPRAPRSLERYSASSIASSRSRSLELYRLDVDRSRLDRSIDRVDEFGRAAESASRHGRRHRIRRQSRSLRLSSGSESLYCMPRTRYTSKLVHVDRYARAPVARVSV